MTISRRAMSPALALALALPLCSQVPGPEGPGDRRSAAVAAQRASSSAWVDAYRAPARRILDAAQADDAAWRRLAELTDTFGHRLSGSPQLEAAIRWTADEMNKDGFENVHLEPVMVPRWVRGEESAELVAPARHPLVMLGLGGSVGTPAGGIEAEAIVVSSFEEMQAQAARVAGRIVVFNAPFTHYAETVRYRTTGASRAAQLGAVASLVRAVGPPGLRTPHTGALQYAAGVPRIPAAAIATEDADRLQRMQGRGAMLRIRLRMGAQTLPDTESANVIAELRGRERPDEIVVVGGHIDSWDVGAGALDDGGGCVATWEAVRLLKTLGLVPRRTIRIVLFTNEENGLRGGLAYRDRHRDELGRHVMMLESDAGVFRPRGFGFSGSDRARQIVRQIASLLAPIGADRVAASGGGADIGPSVQAAGIPSMSLDVEGNYFMYHHTAADTVDKIPPAELALSVGAIAVMTYVVADMPQALSR